MNGFHWPRFRHVLANDFLQQWKKIWIATLALAGIGLIAYLTNVDPRAAGRPELYMAQFPAILLLGGLILTSGIFADLHHPLQRFHYLTLPCSNLERFASRYLLSGPLFCLYVVIVYTVFDWLASLTAHATMGASAAAFSPFDSRVIAVVLTYLGFHSLAFAGAIHFRSHSMIKTLLTFIVVGLILVAVHMAAVRIVFWDHFTTFLPIESGVAVPLWFIPPPVMRVLGLAFSLWVLFIAFQSLREHEVQGEL